jgi:alkanesulfonate monooxygenase SsuD/methylene tetrahydromethanopterin reductase-like flavin-dependent oxidoreductase (luciferase family)
MRCPFFGLLDLLDVDPAQPTAQSLHAHCELLREADTLGVDYLFIAERHFVREQRAATPTVLLGALAATTTRARIGVLACTLPLHNAVQLAEEISALDHLSNGRLDIGIGLGHVADELRRVHVPVERRDARLREDLALMHALWQGEPVTYTSDAWQISDVLVDAPLQRPHPPLWYAGTDPAAATWAAEHGLNVALGFQPDAMLLAPAAAFRRATPAGTARMLAVARRIYVAETDEAAETEVRATLRRQHAAHGSSAPAHAPTMDDAARQYADRLQRQILVAGSPETVAREITRSMRTLDADLFLGIPADATDDGARAQRSVRLFATDVMPRVRAALRTTMEA